MKIGKFSSENNVSIDTIRHYMELGLIIPEKIGGHYDFDEVCKRDLEEIFTLKSMEFTLNEIKSIFLFKRLGKLTPYQEVECYRQFFISKCKKIKEQIEELHNAKLKLEDEIDRLSSNEDQENRTLGVDISALSLFKCLMCGKDLTLHEGHIANNQVINGILRCKCGNEYTIDDGVLIGKNNIDDYEENLNYNDRKLYIAEYLNETDLKYLDNIYKGLDWAYKKLNFEELRGKKILDLGSGSGFLLRQIYNDLPESSLYIAVDHDIERHRFLKAMLEKAECQKKVIFICSDFLDIPIKDKSIDMLLDYTGTSNYSFENEEFLLKLIDKLVKDDAFLLGGYILFAKFSVTSWINHNYRKNFILKNVKEELKNLGYIAIDERVSEVLNKGGRFENYFKEDEKVYTYGFYGRRY
ncbi:MerR family transcriptional regulator [Wukongibacter baidiensis]|uniref:MerR family transcriptional regulator n=1 Tax=Wukongibacter baidiensis TaxID=1723361 RepID=UPI003D7FDE75